LTAECRQHDAGIEGGAPDMLFAPNKNGTLVIIWKQQDDLKSV
jgi:hypothetical protein